MVRVSEQFGYRLGLGRVVVTADLAMSIHEHHPRAVHWDTLLIAAIGNGQLETIVRQFVNRTL